MTLFGLIPASFWVYLVYTLIVTHITVISVTIFLHRGQAHRSMDLHPLVSHFFRFWLWFTTGIVTKEWVAIHRKHHTECETEQDPHSPQVLGLKKVLLEGAELYQEEAKNQETLNRYGKNTPNDWIEKHLYSPPKLRSLGITLLFILNVVLFGIPGIAIWAIQMMWIPFFAAGVVNGLGHFWGYRNFECPDAARNISPIGIIMGGEELHNNHHTFAASAKLSVHWWEFDIGWFYISILKFLRLAKVHRSVPKLQVNPNKMTLDSDSLSAIISNRFHVMNDYWREVIVPIMKAEKEFLYTHGKRFTRDSGKLLVREESIIKQADQNFLQTMLKGHSVFETVYNFRLKLQEIWSTTNISQQELLDVLNRWCKQAESTGIAALQDFAKRLRYYSMQGT
ncbi:MAG: fatty acid desaturase [Gammaproteobacteria bacterium]|nr:fatty acid desaturase [Gammaproteobacteria bacterium]